MRTSDAIDVAAAPQPLDHLAPRSSRLAEVSTELSTRAEGGEHGNTLCLLLAFGPEIQRPQARAHRVPMRVQAARSIRRVAQRVPSACCLARCNPVLSDHARRGSF